MTITAERRFARPPLPRTTGIGSLPHHNVDAALEHSFRMGIPFLPQIPIRNPWEFMLAQALEGLPGLQADRDGSVTLNTDIWLSRAADFNARLDAAFRSTEPAALQGFEPTPSISSCWQPFVWELGERGVASAKVQIAGPMTAQWALTLRDSAGREVASPSFHERNPELATQIFRLVLARALAMGRRLKAQGAEPILFLDEPGLYGLTLSNPRHVLALQELKVLIQTLRKEGVQVGVHCCSNTDWSAVLSLPIHFLSLDAALSLPSLLAHRKEFGAFVAEGGRLALGAIPTGRPGILRSVDVATLVDSILAELAKAFASEPATVRTLLSEAILTPACGLALQSVADAEVALAALQAFEERLNRVVGTI